MARAEDALELLLPQAEPALMSRARDVTRFLRLLSDDAVSARASSVGIDWDRARAELEQHDLQRLVRGITDLLRHHLNAIARGESFAWHGETALDVQDAWRSLNEFRDEMPWLAGVPEPDESALRVSERLLESLARLQIPDTEIALWRIRVLRWTDGLRAAESEYRAQLERTRGDVRPAVQRALVAGVAACLLERGAVREARAWLLERLAFVERDPHLRHLLAWSRLATGDFPGAKRTLLGLKPWSGTLPQALVELRSHHPEWLPCLAGRAPSSQVDPSLDSISPPLRRTSEPVRSRADVGAAVFCVFRFEPGRGALAVIADVAPALRDALDAWLCDREDAWSVPSEHEHRLVVSARALRIHAESESAIAGVLGRETTRALILAPVLDGNGEVAGWLHMEFEHHLAPSSARTRMLAETWSAELARAAAVEERSNESQVTMRLPDDLCAAVFQRTVLELGIKTSQRRWWGFNVEADATREVSAGGEGSLDVERCGEQRALRRAVMTGGNVVFDEPSDKLAVSADAGSGVALPLLAAKRVCGALVLESTRRHDFRDGDIERYAHVLGRAGLALRLAQFRTWHRATFGFDLWFDAARADFQSFARHALVAARSRAPVVMFGAAGTGKLVFTRWLHFESEGCNGPIKVFSCSLGTSRGRLAGMLDDACDGTLVLDDVEALDPSLQEELLRWLEGVDAAGASALGEESPSDRDVDAERASSPRILATTRVGLVEAARAGSLRADLALRLNRLQLRLPALKERREDIVPLVHCLSRRFAAEEAIALPTFTDEALAMLWRQPWEGNVRELENVVYKLVLLNATDGAPAQSIDVELVTRIARHFDLDLARKLNSRHPLRSDLMAALRETRMGAGRINKTRAAQYLGWDPDTLVARMQDLGMQDDGDLDPSAWSDEPSETAPSDPSS